MNSTTVIEKHPCLFLDFGSAGVFFPKYRSASGGKRNDNNFNWQVGVHIHIVFFFWLVYKTCHIREFVNISSLLPQVIVRVAPKYPLVKYVLTVSGSAKRLKRTAKLYLRRFVTVYYN